MLIIIFMLRVGLRDGEMMTICDENGDTKVSVKKVVANMIGWLGDEDVVM